MKEPPGLKCHEGIQKSFDSSASSDVIIEVGGSDPNHFWGHRAILAAGSRGFAAYFHQHPEDGIVDRYGKWDTALHVQQVCTFYAGPLFTSSGSNVSAAVLRHLYGLPLLNTQDRRDHDNDCSLAVRFWRNLVSEAIALGVPSLFEHAQAEFETTLKKLLFDKTIGHPNNEDDVRKFVTEAHSICLCAEDAGQGFQSAISKAEDAIAKLCREHYTELRKYGSFNEFAAQHPKFLLKLLDDFTSHGAGDLK